ncbi:MAG: MarR family winged helix-turn-helix transcriptional regulator [Burkholderiaceae bacterium]
MTTNKRKIPQSIGRQLNFTTGRMNALCQQVLDPHDLTLPQWAILSCLWRDEALTIGALSELVGTGLPAASRIVDRMVERDLVNRRRDDADGRITVVTLTDSGRELNHLADFYETINAKLFKGFSAKERQLAFELLQRMESNAHSALED